MNIAAVDASANLDKTVDKVLIFPNPKN